METINGNEIVLKVLLSEGSLFHLKNGRVLLYRGEQSKWLKVTSIADIMPRNRVPKMIPRGYYCEEEL